MEITVEHEGETLLANVTPGSTIRDVISSLDIHPSTVLAVFNGVIIPHDSQLNEDVLIELITVSSGG